MLIALLTGCSHLEPLSNAYSAFGRDLPDRRAEPQSGDPEPIPVRIPELASDPQRFHQTRVRTEGYVTLQFEGNRVCSNPSATEPTDCIWLDIEGLSDPGFRRGQAVVEGTFNGNNLGHFGAASGAIERIEVLRRLQ
jgi:hypothetical protein